MERTSIRLSDQTDEQVAAYRSVTPWAVVSLLLGLASPLALVQVTLWCVPALAIATGLAAIRSIRKNPAEIIGGKLALTGIGLALFFGAWAPARLLHTANLVASEARAYSQVWLELVREGDLQRAHQQTLNAGERIFDAARLDEYYQNNADAYESFQKFVSKEPMASLRKMRESLKWTFSGNPEQSRDIQGRYVQIPVRIGGDVDGAPVELDVQLRVMRRTRERISVWQVLSLADAAENQ